jgi:hypothetical protein
MSTNEALWTPGMDDIGFDWRCTNIRTRNRP